jgi:flagellin
MATNDVGRIASNIGALNALNSLNNINKQLSIHQTRLSTGKRINSAADDPAGLTIATKMLARTEGLKTALDNIGDAKNMLSVAESGLSKMNDILIQMRNKAQQAASDTLGSSERQAIQTQLSAYSQQIDDIVKETKWNGVKLLDGTVNNLQFQTGADSTDFTNWGLSQAHDATTLNLSKKVTADGVVSGSFAASGTSITASAFSGTPLGTLTKAETGTYNVNVLDTAQAGTGLVNLSSSTYPAGVSTVAANSTALNGTELSDGSYTFEITGGSSLTDRTNVNYRVVKSDGSVVANVTGADLSGATEDIGRTGTGAGTNAGFSVGFSGGLVANTSFSFEYIQRGHAKYELTDGQGAALTVDQDGTGAGTATGLNGYAAAGGSVDTGRGIQFTLAAIASIHVNDSAMFSIQKAGNYVVDVSTASKASTYMDTVSSAVSKVNESLSSLGSMLARFTFKEDQITSAKSNVEASYSRIMNADMAEEQVNASKYSILQQTATAMLAQANQAPQYLLSLFR